VAIFLIGRWLLFFGRHKAGGDWSHQRRCHRLPRI
jgi:hypothetical protein